MYDRDEHLCEYARALGMWAASPFQYPEPFEVHWFRKDFPFQSQSAAGAATDRERPQSRSESFGRWNIDSYPDITEPPRL